jgi:hypothetical protein
MKKTNRTKWSRVDLDLLHVLAHEGYTPEGIALELGRTAQAVKSKVQREGILWEISYRTAPF